MLRPATRLEWTFVSITIIQAFVVIALQIYILIRYLDWVSPESFQLPSSYVVPVAFSTSTIGFLFQAILAVDSCAIKNKIQIWAQCFVNICFSIAMGLQYLQIKDAIKTIVRSHAMPSNPSANNDEQIWKVLGPLSICCTAFSTACSIGMCSISYPLYREFSWSVYQQISPDLKMKSRHSKYLAYLVFLKISLLLLILFVITYGFVDVRYKQPEFGLTMAIIPASIIHSILAALCAKSEYLIGMMGVITCHVGATAYLAYKLVVLYSTETRGRTLMKEEMVLFAHFALNFNIMSIVAAVLCTLNFGKGLKQLLKGRNAQGTVLNDVELHSQQLNIRMEGSEHVLRRFDID